MSKTIYQFKVKDKNGNEVSLENYKGKVLLIVNTATECGFTPQFSGLEELHQEFKDEDFEILGFPSNQFGGQEPRNNEEISEFCQINYGLSFDLFDKIDVKGDNAHPLYQFLADKTKNGKVNSTPKWNFHKYLINKQGEVVDYYLMLTKPTANKIKRKIRALLQD